MSEASHHGAHPAPLSRRDSIRVAAGLALGTGLGVPTALLALPADALQLQLKFYKADADGGALVGSVELMDAVTSFIGSSAGARTQMKWYDGSGRELGSMGIPVMIQQKIMTASQALKTGG